MLNGAPHAMAIEMHDVVRNHYARALQVLVDNVDACSCLTGAAEQKTENGKL